MSKLVTATLMIVATLLVGVVGYTMNIELETRREILSICQEVVDTIADTGEVSAPTKAKLNTNLAATGVILSANIEREVKIAVPAVGDKAYKILYQRTDKTETFNKGDRVTVRVKELQQPFWSSITRQLLGLYLSPIDYSYTRIVRY